MKQNVGSTWQICGSRAGLSAQNVAAVMLVCCLTAGINVRAAAARAQ